MPWPKMVLSSALADEESCPELLWPRSSSSSNSEAHHVKRRGSIVEAVCPVCTPMRPGCGLRCPSLSCEGSEAALVVVAADMALCLACRICLILSRSCSRDVEWWWPSLLVLPPPLPLLLPLPSPPLMLVPAWSTMLCKVSFEGVQSERDPLELDRPAQGCQGEMEGGSRLGPCLMMQGGPRAHSTWGGEMKMEIAGGLVVEGCRGCKEIGCK